MKIESWGRLYIKPHEIISLSAPQDVPQTLANHRPGIAYGMGRSYGDACLNPGGKIWMTSGLDHFVSFDDAKGTLVCEAGALLKDIQETFTPRGWMLPVTPGTQFVTVGGAIANDVHGKNHHVAGSFGDNVISLRLVRTNGQIIDCTSNKESEWFAATVGGIGLTGLIVEATLQLKRIDGPWLLSETIPYQDIDEFFSLADNSESEWEYTVSWLDCISGQGGRGIFIRAKHEKSPELPPPRAITYTLPITPPVSLVNRWSLQAFNQTYFHFNRWKSGTKFVHYRPFFYPLDNLLQWNRMYGPKGFFQYQCVIPKSNREGALREILKEIARSGQGSFLAILKTFGNRIPVGMLSFPSSGVTLALDFPNRGADTETLFGRLDRIVIESEGRLYLAKDARMPRLMFEKTYPRHAEFMKYRDTGISSAMSRRLMGI